MASFLKVHKEPYPALSKAVEGSPLAGKSFLVTGAGRGIGEHIARQIATAGAGRVGIIGRDKTRIFAAKERFEKNHPHTKFEAFAADINDEAAVSTVFETFGVPDVLINNAGHFADEGPFVDQDLSKWWSGFEINILGTAVVTQQFLRARAKAPAKAALVLNVSSMATHFRFPLIGWSGYTGSKLGQARIFEHIRFEHPDVNFVNVHPGNIPTDGYARTGADTPPDGWTDGTLAGQFYAWLASTDAEFLSGRFVWAEWDIDELKAKKAEIVEKDLLRTTIDGLVAGF